MPSLSVSKFIAAAVLSLVLVAATYVAFSDEYHPAFWRMSTAPGALSFRVPKAAPVAMSITDSVRYQLDTSGAEDYAKLLPSGGHIVYIDDDDSQTIGPEPYTVTLFHQFRCLDIIRDSINQLSLESTPVSTMTRHCMNYLRQTILCQPNLRLESAKTSGGVAARTYDAVCRDWTPLYEEAERNHQAYLAWSAERDAAA